MSYTMKSNTMRKKSGLALCLCAVMVLALLCSCSNKPKELRGVEITSIDIYLDFDEADISKNQSSYNLAILRAANTSIKDNCLFTYNLAPSGAPEYEWTEDADGTKHMHPKGDNSGSVEYEISVFKNVLGLIEKGAPSFYTGPSSDSSGRIVRKTLPYMIVLHGTDKGGAKSIYIDGLKNQPELFEAIERLKKSN